MSKHHLILQLKKILKLTLDAANLKGREGQLTE